MKPRLIMFDFDGTLADSFGWFLDASEAIADRFRFQRFDRSERRRVYFGFWKRARNCRSVGTLVHSRLVLVLRRTSLIRARVVPLPLATS